MTFELFLIFRQLRRIEQLLTLQATAPLDALTATLNASHDRLLAAITANTPTSK